MSNPIDNLVSALAAATDGDDQDVIAPPPAKKARTGRSKKGGDIPREKRLEQNRKAAIESRRRKKEMVSCTCLATLGGEELFHHRQVGMDMLCSAACLRSLLLANTITSLSSSSPSFYPYSTCAGR